MIEKLLALEKTNTFKIIVFCVIVAGAWYAVTDLIAKHDQATADRFTQLLATEKAATAATQSQLVQQAAQFTAAQAQYNTDRAALLAQVQTLTVAIASRDAATKAANAKVSTLPQDTVATQIVTGLGLVATDVAPQTDGSYIFDRNAANATLISINNLTGLQSDLADTKSELVAETKRADESDALLASANNLITQGKDLITAKDKIIELEEKNTAAQIAAVKADERKSKAKWVMICSAVFYIIGHAVR